MLYWLLGWLLTLFGLWSAGHALLNKRDPRSALIWIVLCLGVPGVGAFLYWVLGVNRIRMTAKDWQLRGQGMFWHESELCPWSFDQGMDQPFRLENFCAQLALADKVTRRPLLQGNKITPLHNGEEAYPAMLQSLAAARHSIYLSTYIFDSDGIGFQFAEALRAAAERGVDVRVLVDGLGERYSFPPIRRQFRKSKVRYVRFLPPSLSGRGIHLNLRNHRKLLVVDGETGYTGGMNIGERHLVQRQDPARVVDIHFRVEGPVVGQLQEAFLEDWSFATREPFRNIAYPPAPDAGHAFCRGISAGPNEDFEKLVWLLIGALNCARSRVRIMTPYFIPDRAMITAINTAALRGVRVEILLPEKNNLPYVDWATRSYLWELLQHGVAVYYQPPPFVHSKLLLVDDHYAQIGSANLDPRSLRLNFEFTMEIYDRHFVDEMSQHFERVREVSTLMTLEKVDARPLGQKIRDAGVKLFSPYL
ncbi:MAG: cardiolipin synthase [Desulfuromonadales bacterium]|nr:cardiolipin synthase [Desulfuromonadales bacterium]MDW7757014.1 cardiolipin synthase [Desulfuromonadales bacterium]